MIDPQVINKEKAELTSKLANDGHQVEEIRPEEWKVIVSLIRDPGEAEKWFENFLDTDLLTALRCQACGRAFLLLAVKDDTGALIDILLTDEEGSDIDIAEEVPCMAGSRHEH
jgi:hypothetical protein